MTNLPNKRHAAHSTRLTCLPTSAVLLSALLMDTSRKCGPSPLNNTTVLTNPHAATVPITAPLSHRSCWHVRHTYSGEHDDSTHLQASDPRGAKSLRCVCDVEEPLDSHHSPRPPPPTHAGSGASTTAFNWNACSLGALYMKLKLTLTHS